MTETGPELADTNHGHRSSLSIERERYTEERISSSHSLSLSLELLSSATLATRVLSLEYWERGRHTVRLAPGKE